MASFPAYVRYEDGTVGLIASARKIPYGVTFTFLSEEQAEEYKAQIKEQQRQKAMEELTAAIQEAEAALIRATEIARENGLEFEFRISENKKARFVGDQFWQSSAGSCGWFNPGEDDDEDGWV